MSKGYDPQCQILAEYFIDGDPAFTKKHVPKLAQVIQDSIENYMAEVEHDADATAEAAKDEAVDRAIDERQLGEDI